MQRGQLSVSVIGASQRFGNPVVSVSNINKPLFQSCYLLGSLNPFDIDRVFNWFQHFKISKNQKIELQI
jgi:hypothetical protein